VKLALSLLVGSLLLAATTAETFAQSAQLVSIRTPRGATQKFILIKPDKPVAAVILFAGGHGALGLRSATSMNWGAGNFLVRTRQQFANHRLMVAVMDAPSDRANGMKAIFRMGKGHAGDIGAVAGHLKAIANLPVWLVGTSMGTFSAAGGALGAKGVNGLVLTSTITRSRPQWKIAGSHPRGVASMPLGRFAGPAFVMSHRNDGCPITPAADAPYLLGRLTSSPRKASAIMTGGRTPVSEPCEARSQHGFYGIEGAAVGRIASFIAAGAPGQPALPPTR
jgi:hypothetical protein